MIRGQEFAIASHKHIAHESESQSNSWIIDETHIQTTKCHSKEISAQSETRLTVVCLRFHSNGFYSFPNQTFQLKRKQNLFENNCFHFRCQTINNTTKEDTNREYKLRLNWKRITTNRREIEEMVWPKRTDRVNRCVVWTVISGSIGRQKARPEQFVPYINYVWTMQMQKPIARIQKHCLFR